VDLLIIILFLDAFAVIFMLETLTGKKIRCQDLLDFLRIKKDFH